VLISEYRDRWVHLYLQLPSLHKSQPLAVSPAGGKHFIKWILRQGREKYRLWELEQLPPEWIETASRPDAVETSSLSRASGRMIQRLEQISKSQGRQSSPELQVNE
jgi:hypothetical protein